MRMMMLSIAILFAVPLWAQQPAQPADAGVSLRLPSSISGELVPAEATAEGQRNREWESTMEVGAECDDNALFSSKDRVSDCSYSVRPSIAYRQAGSRSSWNLMYAPGFVAHQRFSEFNEMAHSLGIDAQHRFTRRLHVRVRESFVKSTNFFNGLEPSPDLPTFGQVQAPNGIVALPAARVIASTSGLESTYQLNATSFVGLAASYSDLQYEGTDLNNTGLSRQQTGTAGAVYNRLVGRRHWIGVNYNFQHLRAGDLEWATSHSVLYTHTIILSKHLAVSAFVGPTHSRDHTRMSLSEPALDTGSTLTTNWSISAGGAVGWSTPRNNIEASVARRVTDGGGFIGPSILSSATLTFERQLNARLSTSFSGRLGETTALGANEPAAAARVSGFRTALLQAGFQYQLREHVRLRANYGRDWQELTGSSEHIHRNGLSVSLSYSFSHPLGR